MTGEKEGRVPGGARVPGAPAELPENQIVFDIFFGIVAPILCYLFDPIVFQARIFDRSPGFLHSVRWSVCGLAVLAMVCLTVWLAFGRARPRLDALLGGGMLAGALLAFAIGVVILPLAVLGLFYYFVGVFGFIPFVTFRVFWRNMRLAWRHARRRAGAGIAARVALLGFALVVTASLVGWRVCEACLPRAGIMATDAPEDD